MITIPPLGPLHLSHNINSEAQGLKNNLSRNGSVLDLIMRSRDHSNRDSRESSAGPPSRQSSNASVSSVSSLMQQDSPSSGSQFFEVLYLGKIKSVSHRKAPPTFIDEVVEKIRLYNETEQQKRQTSLPVPCINRTPGCSPIGSCNISPTNSVPKFTSNSALIGTRVEEEEPTSQRPPDQEPKTPSSSPVGSCEISPTNSVSKFGSSSALIGTRVDEEEPHSERLADQETKTDTLAILTKTEEVLNNISARMENQVGGSHFDSDSLLSPGSFRARTCSGSNDKLYQKGGASLEPMRGRASSMGSNSSSFVWKRTFSLANSETNKNGSHDLNRTMLFQISRNEVRLISPDKKSVLLNKPFKDISHCSQGKKHGDTFGFICREANSDNNVCYVFKCQNSGVADEIMAVLKQAFHSAAEALKKVQGSSCDHCPIIWLNRLALELEGLPAAKAQSLILKRISSLAENDQQELVAKFQGAEITGTKQQNELLMLLLRAHCETRQLTHVHDTAEQRHEFLSQYLDRGSGAIFQKAKRSLTSSFDQLLKRKTKDQSDTENFSRENSLTNGVAAKELVGGVGEATPTKQIFRYDIQGGLSQSPLVKNDLPPIRPRSSTLGTTGGETIKKELMGMKQRNKKFINIQESEDQNQLEHQQSLSKTPIMDIFLKMGVPGPLNVPVNQENAEKTPSPRKSGSWRQAIFQQVVTPGSSTPSASDLITGNDSQNDYREKRTREQLRQLWKWAIRQQILLIRMERENKRIRVRQEEMSIKRVKLNYDELLPCPRESHNRWESLITSRISADSRSITDLIRTGVPKHRRGEIWQFLVQSNVVGDDWDQPIDFDDFPNIDLPYEELLHQLTSHQHPILIDLGRTFPTHPYFAAPLGAGQLALYNLLKAYSLLDNQVGYCQGLSFIAGILLLHTEEEAAYSLLRYLMLDVGLRRQYLPDMAQLQVQLYQMTRLVRDLHRDLYEHLEQNDVNATLYAAPWFLTLFASQFPMGFVVRVFDLIFLLGVSAVFRVAVSLLADHKDMLLQCRNFEQIMDYMKTTLPSMGASQMQRVLNDALDLDLSRQLAAYEVEYHVLQEEMASGGTSCSSSPNSELLQKIQQLEKSNEILQKQIRDAQGQLQASRANARVLEANLTANQAACTRLERQLHDCESDRTALVQLVTDLAKLLPRGQELVVPPGLVKCFEEHKQKGLISISIGPNLRINCQDQGLTMKQCTYNTS